MKHFVIIPLIFSTLILSISCKKEELESNSCDTTTNNIEPLEKRLTVSCPLGSSLTDRQSLGYYWEYAKYSTFCSVWTPIFMVAVFDKETLEPWASLEHGDFGHINYNENKYVPQWNNYVFYFSNNTEEGLRNFMKFVNTVPEGNSILVYTFKGNNCAEILNSNNPIKDDYKDFLSNIGASIDQLKGYPNNYPYILFYQKGNSLNTNEVFYNDSTSSEFWKSIIFETTLKNY